MLHDGLALKARALLLALVGLAVLGWACSGQAWEPAASRSAAVGDRTPIVFVSGATGTRLRDPRTGHLVWGGTRQLLSPHDGGYAIVLPLMAGAAAGAPHPQAVYETAGPIWQFRLLGWKKRIYRPLVERFAAAGYRLGELESPGSGGDLFFFDYDWRYGNLESVRSLDRRLEALGEARGGLEVDLVCQSNAAKICRWLGRYGALDLAGAEAGVSWRHGYRIRKLVLVGASNNGALRVLQQLDRGRSYISVIGRRLQPETLFSIRPLFEDLPADRDDLFFDESGQTMAVDLFDAQSWMEYGWSIFGPEPSERLRRHPREDLFGSPAERLAYLQEQLDRSRRFQRLLARDSGAPLLPRYYLLENASAPTIDRALLTRERGAWRTWFLGDPRVDRDPALMRLAAAPGDGHAVLASQRGLSPQERAAVAGTASVEGGHFEAIVRPEALDAILAFLAEPTVSNGRPQPEG